MIIILTLLFLFSLSGSVATISLADPQGSDDSGCESFGAGADADTAAFAAATPGPPGQLEQELVTPATQPVASPVVSPPGDLPVQALSYDEPMSTPALSLDPKKDLIAIYDRYALPDKYRKKFADLGVETPQVFYRTGHSAVQCRESLSTSGLLFLP